MKKGDRVRLKGDHRKVFILYADPVGGQIWVGSEKDKDSPYPHTRLAEDFEPVPDHPYPAYGQTWEWSGAPNVRVLNVCGEWVIYEPVDSGSWQELKNARHVDAFTERYRFLR